MFYYTTFTRECFDVVVVVVVIVVVVVVVLVVVEDTGNYDMRWFRIRALFTDFSLTQ